MKIGVATIYQELDLVDGLSVAENIFLGHEHATGGFTRPGQTRAAARDLLRRLGHSEIPPGREVGRLSAAGKQIVSMARALSHDARLIVMDEPSAVLDSGEVDEPVPRHPRPDRRGRRRRLHLAPARGDPRDRRPGHRAQGRPHGRHRPARGGHPDRRAHPADDRPLDRVRLPGAGRRRPTTASRCSQVEGLSRPGEFHDVTLHRARRRDRRAGRTGRLRPLGDPRDRLRRPQGVGRQGHRRRARPCATARCGAAVGAGVGLAPEERKSQALLLDQSVTRNITLATPGPLRHGPASSAAATSARRPRSTRRRSTSARPAYSATARTLSGGNQQKVVLARWLLRGCRRAAARRADPRRRRRRAQRDLRA